MLCALFPDFPVLILTCLLVIRISVGIILQVLKYRQCLCVAFRPRWLTSCFIYLFIKKNHNKQEKTIDLTPVMSGGIKSLLGEVWGQIFFLWIFGSISFVKFFTILPYMPVHVSIKARIRLYCKLVSCKHFCHLFYYYLFLNYQKDIIFFLFSMLGMASGM